MVSFLCDFSERECEREEEENQKTKKHTPKSHAMNLHSLFNSIYYYYIIWIAYSKRVIFRIGVINILLLYGLLIVKE